MCCSQNTVFLHDALWATLIPISTTFRVCDIWRGYWTQRLLFDIGGQLAFTPPSVLQYRNAHNSFTDFLDELDLYTKAGSLVSFLHSWQPSDPLATLPLRMVELATDMEKEGFWGRKDVNLMKDWVSDLTVVGYKFPTTVEEPIELDRTDDAAAPRCWDHYQEITAILMFNNHVPEILSIATTLHERYSYIFGRVVLTGAWLCLLETD